MPNFRLLICSILLAFSVTYAQDITEKEYLLIKDMGEGITLGLYTAGTASVDIIKKTDTEHRIMSFCLDEKRYESFAYGLCEIYFKNTKDGQSIEKHYIVYDVDEDDTDYYPVYDKKTHQILGMLSRQAGDLTYLLKDYLEKYVVGKSDYPSSTESIKNLCHMHHDELFDLNETIVFPKYDDSQDPDGTIFHDGPQVKKNHYDYFYDVLDNLHQAINDYKNEYNSLITIEVDPWRWRITAPKSIINIFRNIAKNNYTKYKILFAEYGDYHPTSDLFYAVAEKYNYNYKITFSQISDYECSFYSTEQNYRSLLKELGWDQKNEHIVYQKPRFNNCHFHDCAETCRTYEVIFSDYGDEAIMRSSFYEVAYKFHRKNKIEFFHGEKSESCIFNAAKKTYKAILQELGWEEKESHLAIHLTFNNDCKHVCEDRCYEYRIIFSDYIDVDIESTPFLDIVYSYAGTFPRIDLVLMHNNKSCIIRASKKDYHALMNKLGWSKKPKK